MKAIATVVGWVLVYEQFSAWRVTGFPSAKDWAVIATAVLVFVATYMFVLNWLVRRRSATAQRHGLQTLVVCGLVVMIKALTYPGSIGDSGLTTAYQDWYYGGPGLEIVEGVTLGGAMLLIRVGVLSRDTGKKSKEQ